MKFKNKNYKMIKKKQEILIKMMKTKYKVKNKCEDDLEF